MSTGKKVLLTFLLALICALGVFVWAGSYDKELFWDSDSRDAQAVPKEIRGNKTGVASTEGLGALRRAQIMAAESRSANLMQVYFGVGIAVLSLTSALLVWVPSKARAPNHSLGATPEQPTPTEPSPSSGAPHL